MKELNNIKNIKTMKVQLTIVLQVDAETEEECQKILQEMDYDFSCISTYGYDRIITQEITEQEINIK